MVKKNQKNEQALSTLCTALAAGLQALPDTAFSVGGESMPKSDAVGPLAAFPQAVLEVAAADTTHAAAVKKKDAAGTAAHAVIALFVPYLKARFGRHNAALETQFGIKPDKVPAPKVATKAAGAAKGAATKKAKKAAVAAVTTPAAPAPVAPSPAAPAATPAANVKT